MFGNPNASLYTNKIIGFPHTSEFLTTLVNLNEPRKPPEYSSSSSSSDDNDEGDDDNNISDAEMRNASSSTNSPSNRGNSTDSSQNGPAKRPKSFGPSSKNFEQGEPSKRGNRVGRNILQTKIKSNTCLKGTIDLSIKQKSFKISKVKTIWRFPSNDEAAHTASLNVLQAAHSKITCGIFLKQNSPPMLNSPFDLDHPNNPLLQTFSTQNETNPLSTGNHSQNKCLTPPPLKQLTTHSSSRASAKVN